MRASRTALIVLSLSPVVLTATWLLGAFVLNSPWPAVCGSVIVFGPLLYLAVSRTADGRRGDAWRGTALAGVVGDGGIAGVSSEAASISPSDPGILAPLSLPAHEVSMQPRNERVGFILFGIYLLLYGGFVFLSAFAPETMERTPITGVNLAILYGFGLIIAAFVMAVLYGVLCGRSGNGAGEGDE